MKFLRHFQTEVDPGTPVSEWQLSDEGRKEMKEFVSKTEFDVETIYTSTEPKAVETAERIAEKSGVELVKTELLCEVDRSSEGFVEDQDKYLELAEDYLKGGKQADWESQEKARKRFEDFMEMSDSDSIAVTHGLFLSLNIPDSNPVKFWHKLGFGQFVHYDF